MSLIHMIIGADIVPTESNVELFQNGDARTLVGEELLEILQEAKFRVFNLEVPFADQQTPIAKCGPALSAPTDTIPGYLALDVDVLAIANNHIMDQGPEGFTSTLQVLNRSRIAYVGGGETPEEAARPYIGTINGKKIGIYACAEHEFSIVSATMPGANPYDPLESFDHVADLKSYCDYVIVLYHGGKEHYRYPSPNLQRICRKFALNGADLVVCQHSHCIGAQEKYNGSTIVYGQGNFLFDYSVSEYWKTSLLIQIDDKFEVSYIPLIKEKNTVRLAAEQEATRILYEFEERSEEIQRPGFIEQKYREFASARCADYLLKFSGVGHNFFFRVMNKLTHYKWQNWYLKRRFRQSELLAIQNFISCEAHNELVAAGIKERLL